VFWPKVGLLISLFLVYSLFSPASTIPVSGSSDTVSLSAACVNGLQVDINGVALPGASVTSINWLWGDGTQTTGFFPQSHTYLSYGEYTVYVVAHYNDGSTAQASETVNVVMGQISNCLSLTITAGLGGSVTYQASVTAGLPLWETTLLPGTSVTLQLAYGDPISLTANPSPRYSFSSWSTGAVTWLAGSVTSPSINIAIGANVLMTANFAALLTTTVGEGGSVTVQSSGINGGTAVVVGAGATQSWNLPLGSSVLLTAHPASGNIFSTWTLHGGVTIAGSSQCSSPSCSSITVIVNDNGGATANFAVPETSNIWSGYVVFQSSSQAITGVSGSWIVPSVSYINVGYMVPFEDSSEWVGIGGFGSGDPLIQIGTASDLVAAVPNYYAWWELLTSQCSAGGLIGKITAAYECPPQPISMTIHPGDTITASITQTWAGSPGTWLMTMDDLSTSQTTSFSVSFTPPSPGTAEWIVENHCPPALCLMNNFGTVYFGNDYTNAQGTDDATIGSVTAPIGSFVNDQIVMTSTTGTPMAAPSSLSADGTSFSVQWEASPTSNGAQETSTTIIESGSATISQTSTTGASVSISGSTATDGTSVTVTSQILGTVAPPGTAQVNLGLSEFYDVSVSGISSGTARVCITNSGVSSNSVMQYWDATRLLWTSAGNRAITPGSLFQSSTICGDIPVSALSGTPVEVGIDMTPPETTVSISGTQGNNGWFISNVGVILTATDSVDGVASVTYSLDGRTLISPSETVRIAVAGDGIHTLTYYATDNTGNVESQRTQQIKIDTTPPTITSTQNGVSFMLAQSVTPSFTYQDATSGVATCSGSVSALDTSSIGQHSYTITATDVAGNSATIAVSYNVVYKFGRFLPPLVSGDNYKAGSTIPVKFQLTDANGNLVSTAVAHILVDGKPGTPSGSSNAGNIFRYDPTSNQYIFNLNTKSLSTGAHIVTATLDDGSSYSITINLTS
jgi:hypothetical protein